MTGLVVSRRALAQVQSFRGRRGWHVTFDYVVEASGDPPPEQAGSWFPADDLPRTNHGEWEKKLVRDVIAKASAGLTGAARGRAPPPPRAPRRCAGRSTACSRGRSLPSSSPRQRR